VNKEDSGHPWRRGERRSFGRSTSVCHYCESPRPQCRPNHPLSPQRRLPQKTSTASSDLKLTPKDHCPGKATFWAQGLKFTGWMSSLPQCFSTRGTRPIDVAWGPAKLERKVKVKSFLSLLKIHGHGASGGIRPYILTFDTSCWGVVRFTPRLLYPTRWVSSRIGPDFGEETRFLFLKANPDSSVVQLVVVIFIELSQIIQY
jgi:hypothetical protein